jgi:hypothetical protein
MQRIYDLLGLTREEVLFVNAAVPCRSFSITSHSGHGRVVASDPGGHGCNFRKADQFRTPCCDRKHCKYGIIARQHDMLAKGVKEAFEYEKTLNSDFQWGIENPAYGDLPRRDYMQPEQWRTEYTKVSPIDMCAYGGKYKAPKVYYTSMTGYVPEGRTGSATRASVGKAR